MTQRQRSAFILFDGKRSVEDVLVATAALGITLVDVDHMMGLGLLSAHKGGAGGLLLPDVALPDGQEAEGGLAVDAAAVVPERSLQQRYSDAYPIAIELTAALGLKGFRLNLAVEAASGFEQLATLAPRIQEAVGVEKCARLFKALHG